MFTNERPIPSAGGLLFLPLKDYYSFPHRITIAPTEATARWQGRDGM